MCPCLGSRADTATAAPCEAARLAFRQNDFALDPFRQMQPCRRNESGERAASDIGEQCAHALYIGLLASEVAPD